MKKKVLDVAIDIETLSRKPTAAIIAIAARPFCIDGLDGGEPNGMPFSVSIDASSCAMYGLDFDKGTVRYWSELPDEAKQQFLYGFGRSIDQALRDLKSAFEEWKKENEATDVRVWMQGTDFDGSILRNAYMVVFNDDKTTGENESMPWKHCELRDSRTYILEHMSKYHPEAEDPYSPIPQLEGLTKHVAADDVLQLIHNVQFCWKEEQEAVSKWLELGSSASKEESDDAEDNV